MPRYIQYGTAKNAISIHRTKNQKAFIVVNRSGQVKFYPNSRYNNSVICSVRPSTKTLKKIEV